MEVKGILLYQGITRLIFSGCFVDKIGRENPWFSKILISQKSGWTQFYRLLR